MSVPKDLDKLVEVYLKMYACDPLYRAMTAVLEEHGRKIDDFKVNQRIRTTSGLAWVTKLDNNYVHYVYDGGSVGHNPPYCCIPLDEFKPARLVKAGDRIITKGETDWNETGYLVINDADHLDLNLVWVKYGTIQIGVSREYIQRQLDIGEMVYHE